MGRRRATKEEFWETGLRWVEDAPKKKKKVKAKKEEFDMEAASKKELEDFGREKGIELDRREKKSSLVEQLKNFLNL